MKKVLIAVDYNPVSEQVVKAGYKLAQTMGSQVCLIHVVSDISFYGIQYPTFMGYEGYNEITTDLSMAAEMRKVAEDFLKTAADHLNNPSVSTHLADGETAREILNYSKKWKADLLVMGTHSHSVLEKLLMGTVASKVLEKTEIPVFMVPVKK
ncbi:universal stress protein [Salegentibacter chungangensis]|uniref:Universal stress protein n=1 Tax=Salegentibacter chungangensis TaxID=1335724 RepID=A0ABW3NSH3_9FLAO